MSDIIMYMHAYCSEGAETHNSASKRVSVVVFMSKKRCICTSYPNCPQPALSIEWFKLRGVKHSFLSTAAGREGSKQPIHRLLRFRQLVWDRDHFWGWLISHVVTPPLTATSTSELDNCPIVLSLITLSTWPLKLTISYFIHTCTAHAHAHAPLMCMPWVLFIPTAHEGVGTQTIHACITLFTSLFMES